MIRRVSRLWVDAWDYLGDAWDSRIPFMSMLMGFMVVAAGLGALVGLVAGRPGWGAALGAGVGAIVAFGWLWAAVTSRKRRAVRPPEQLD